MLTPARSLPEPSLDPSGVTPEQYKRNMVIGYLEDALGHLGALKEDIDGLKFEDTRGVCENLREKHEIIRRVDRLEALDQLEEDLTYWLTAEKEAAQDGHAR